MTLPRPFRPDITALSSHQKSSGSAIMPAHDAGSSHARDAAVIPGMFSVPWETGAFAVSPLRGPRRWQGKSWASRAPFVPTRSFRPGTGPPEIGMRSDDNTLPTEIRRSFPVPYASVRKCRYAKCMSLHWCAADDWFGGARPRRASRQTESPLDASPRPPSAASSYQAQRRRVCQSGH